MSVSAEQVVSPRQGAAGEVFAAFLRLGLTSFGGPVAHIGYFRAELVERRRWLGEHAYADLVGLCQFLPGPASSQVGFALGLMRGGWWGALAAWAGFTLPSAIILVLFAHFAGSLSASPIGAGLLHGLKLVAVAIVAQAVWGMARRPGSCEYRHHCGDPRPVRADLDRADRRHCARRLCRVAAVLCPCRCRNTGRAHDAPVSRTAGIIGLVVFAALLMLVSLLHGIGMGFALFDRSGAFVVGGGHVVLLLLREAVVAPGWVSDNAFLAGYGATQAMPGPLFTFAAYLGAVVPGP